MLIISQMLTGDVNRMRFIRRYGTSLTLHQENVAEHSYYVILYAMMLADHLNSKGSYRVDTLKVMRSAVFHDMDEARSGDFQRPFKYRSPELQKLINTVSRLEFKDMLIDMVQDLETLQEYLRAWDEAKNDTIEGMVVEFADYLCVVSYILMESTALSQTMTVHMGTMLDFIQHFKGVRYNPIRDLVLEVEKMLAGFMPGENVND